MNVMDAACNVVNDYPGGAVSLAPRLGKAAATLSHEVTRTGTAKLGLETAVTITQLTKDHRILEAFAAACGRMTFPLPETLHEGGNNVLGRLGDLLREQSHVVREVTTAAADNEITLNERKRIVKEVGELIATAVALVAEVGPIPREGGAA